MQMSEALACRRHLSLVSVVAVLTCLVPTLAAQALTCPQTSGSAAISSVSYSPSTGFVSSNGTWSVAGGADSARLDFFLNNSLAQIQTTSGTSGSWSFVDTFSQCGSAVFKVCTTPRFCSGGTCTTCLQQQQCASQGFSSTPCSLPVDGPTCSWTCNGGPFIGAPCSGSCSVTVSNGRPLYRGHWLTDMEEHVHSSSTGTFFLSEINCSSGSTASFDVVDANGGTGYVFFTCGFTEF